MHARTRTPAVILAMLSLGCRPAPATPAPLSPPAPARAATPAPETDARPEPDAHAPAAGLPHTCTIELERFETHTQGHGTSASSSQAAKDAAWAEACAALRKTADLDCRDTTRVGIVTQRSSSLRWTEPPGAAQERYEFDLVLGVRRTAEGFGDAPGDRQEACRRAKAHACEQLVRGPCPEGVRVIAVDGKPPSPAPAPPRATPQPRETI